MKKLISLTAAAVAAILFSGCISGNSGGAEVTLREFTGSDDVLAQKAATDYMNGFVNALKSNDFAQWQPVLDAQGATEITPEKFARMRQELHNAFGAFESAGYLGMLTVGNLRSYLWKFRFSREENGKNIIRDVVFYTKVFCADGQAPAVSGFGVKVF
ncbi:MAG: hypothetical protein IKC94_00235 [Lentisphaeria bacterium]|nr:hypothetical protein [Lentisphaeria bacterium]